MYHKLLVSVVVVVAIFATVCEPQHAEEVCSLPEETIICNLWNHNFHWRYEAPLRNCVRVGAGLCLVNRNGFGTYEECMTFCRGVEPRMQPDCSDSDEDEADCTPTDNK
nr:PREDICTED: uncharacterized protein LOC103313657 [Tribolium castaneum]|eukprot:XP_008195719.1 PREDICTED: uncharacterized protein LOC103313657 [Tribolium castaneum]